MNTLMSVLFLLLPLLAEARIPFNFFPFSENVSVAPTGLSLAQSTRSRTFTVSWTGGSGNGGAGGCKLQYQKDGTTWTDISGTYNCDSNTTTAAAAFPTTNNWTNNFNVTGVSVRLLRSSDSTVMGTFAQRGVCSSTSGSSTSTPNIDEDCNGIWDNSTSSTQSCSPGGPSMAPGASYNFPDTTSCSGYTATFTGVNLAIDLFRFDDAACSVNICMGCGSSSTYLTARSGTIPDGIQSGRLAGYTITGSKDQCIFDPVFNKYFKHGFDVWQYVNPQYEYSVTTFF